MPTTREVAAVRAERMRRTRHRFYDHPTKSGPPCTRCGKPLDARLHELGQNTHPMCWSVELVALGRCR